MRFLVLQEFKLLFTLLVFNLLALGVTLLDGLDLGFQLNDLVLLFGFPGLKVSNTLFEVSFTVLCLKLLPHGKCN